MQDSRMEEICSVLVMRSLRCEPAILAGAHGEGSNARMTHQWGIALGVVGALALLAVVIAAAVVRYHMQYRRKVCQVSSKHAPKSFSCHKGLIGTNAV